MRIIWHTSFRLTDQQDRNDEFLTCLYNNLENKFIDQVVYYGEEEIPVTHSKLKQIHLSKRPTFYDIISRFSKHEINCLANGDMFANRTIALAKKIRPKEFWCLSRYNVIRNKCKTHRFYLGDSQDCWIVKGQLLVGGDYFMGVLGCDNLLAYEAAQNGYTVRNVSLSIFTFHLHKSEERTYSEATRVGTAETIVLLYPECVYRLSLNLLRDWVVKKRVEGKRRGVFFPISFLK